MGCYTLVWADVVINEENFPDENFRNWMLEQEYGTDGVLTDAEIAGVTSIQIWSKDIQSLKGIEYFTALTELYCFCNKIKGAAMDALLESLPTVSSGIMYVIYYENEGNEMTIAQVAAAKTKGWTPYYYDSSEWSWKEYAGSSIAINEENFPDENFRNYLLGQTYGVDGVLTTKEIAGVKMIVVNGKNIQSLKGIEYFTALTTLYCYTNQLTELDVSKNTALTELSCGYNQLTELDVSKNTALTRLWCNNNQLTELDVSQNTALTRLWCDSNQLTALDVSKNTALTRLWCDNNQLTELDVSQNTKLTSLNCGSNQLSTLDVSQNIALTTLYCDANQLTELDVSQHTALTELYCLGNQLTAVNVSGCTALTTLWCYANQIKGAGMDALVESLPTVNSGTMYVIFYMEEQNLMTVAQVAAAKAKGWTPYYFDTNDWGWKEYEGNQPVSEGIAINAENFPDENFRNYLLSQEYGTDGVLTDAEIDGVTDIDVYGENIQSLKGIEYFTALTSLDCSDNHLMKLDVSQNTALTKLYCYENQLTELDLSKNTALKKLKCYNNQLTALDVSQNIALTSLNCYGNRLTKLNVPKNTALTRLECYQNQIKGAAMDALVESLPTVSDGEMYVIWSENEGNVMTTTQVAAAKAKGWIPFAHDGSRWKEYAGSEPVNPDFATLTYSAGSQSTLQMPVKTGEVTLSIKAEENWTVETLTVNGADRLADLKGNKLALSVEGDTEVRVTFCWADAKTLYTEDFETGIATIQGENIRVYARGGQLCIDGADGREVRLYTVGGMLIQSVVPQAGAIAQFALPAGTYIVQVGKKAAKVVVK